MKKKEKLLKELEVVAKSYEFKIRYEKGVFVGGNCRLHENKILIVNKFLPLDGRIATIARVLNQIDIDTDTISSSVKEALVVYG